MLHADFHIVLQAIVGAVHDLVDGEGRDPTVGVGLLIGGQFGLDLDDPLLEQFLGPRIERREGADDARLALRDHQFGYRHDEQRRPDGRQRQATLQNGWHGHAEDVSGGGGGTSWTLQTESIRGPSVKPLDATQPAGQGCDQLALIPIQGIADHLWFSGGKLMIVISRNGKTTVLTGWRAWLFGAGAFLVDDARFRRRSPLSSSGVAVTVGAVLLIALPVAIGVAILASFFRSPNPR